MIPIFRAFSEVFDKYIVGVPYFNDGRYYMLVDDCNKNNNIGSGSYPIDETTLAIHFPDMLDSQGNKIFASLQEDGKGGDLIDNFNFQEKYRIQTAIYKYNCFHLMDKDNDTYSLIECKLQKGIKVIGVKE